MSTNTTGYKIISLALKHADFPLPKMGYFCPSPGTKMGQTKQGPIIMKSSAPR